MWLYIYIPRTWEFIFCLGVKIYKQILQKERPESPEFQSKQASSKGYRYIYIPRRPFVWEISIPSLFELEISFPTLNQENEKIFKIRIIF